MLKEDKLLKEGKVLEEVHPEVVDIYQYTGAVLTC